MALIAAKLFLAPACVVGVSLVGRRWGVAMAGLLGGLPVVAAPILLVLTIAHDAAFGAEAAAGALLGLLALTAFVVVYGRVASWASPAVAVLLGWAAFLIGVALLSLVHPPPLLALIVVGVGFVAGLALIPAPPRATRVPPAPPWWDLPARGLSALVLVVALTAASGVLGPQLSGLLTPFPIVTCVLAAFTHAHGGPDQVRVLMRSFLVGFYGFATFCFTLAVTLDSLSVAAAFSLALLAAVAVQAVTITTRSAGEAMTGRG